MSIDFRLAGDGAIVRVSITRYERAEFSAEADADWLVAGIDIGVDSFTAKLPGSLRSEDFQDFGRQLSAALVHDEGVAEFSTLEDNLRLTVSLSRSGRAAVSGVVTSLDNPKNQLLFAFDTDRTFLKRAETDLERVMTAFPSRASGD